MERAWGKEEFLDNGNGVQQQQYVHKQESLRLSPIPDRIYLPSFLFISLIFFYSVLEN
jgi:hypothetical protein